MHACNGRYMFACCMGVWVLLQVALLKRLLSAFDAVGVLFAALTQMVLKVRRVIVPIVLAFMVSCVNFAIFTNGEQMTAPIMRFIGSEEDYTDPLLIFITVS